MREEPFAIAVKDMSLTLGSETLKVNQLKLLTIESGINAHTQIRMVYEIEEEQKDDYIHGVNTESEIQVSVKGRAVPLFKGVATRMEVHYASGRGRHYDLIVEGISYSGKLDQAIKPTRSFQNQDLMVKDLIAQVLGEDGLCDMTGDQKLGKFIVQHCETDWQFFKRLASGFGHVLIACPYADKPRFDVYSAAETRYNQDQMRTFLKLEELDPRFSIKYKVPDYRHIDAKEATEQYYEAVVSKNHLMCDISQCVALRLGIDAESGREKFRPLYIRQSRLEIDRKSQLSICYTLTPGIEQPVILNHALTGMAVGGRVTATGGKDAESAGETRAKDGVKLDLDSDLPKIDPETATWFKVATPHVAEGHTGLYCLPEIGDQIKLYFPTENEHDAFVLTGVRQDGADDPRLSDPEVKYFRTNFGKEIMFSEKEIVLTVYEYNAEEKKVTDEKKVCIKLNQDNGIEIYSENPVQIISQNDLQLASGSGNIILEAQEGIIMNCKESSIRMNGEVDIKGGKFRAN